jgi:hypothetical protein
LGKKKIETEQPEVITTHVTKVKRVYIVPTTQGVTLDLFVELACGGSTVVSGLTTFCDSRPIQVLRSNIEGDVNEEKEECLEEK